MNKTSDLLVARYFTTVDACSCPDWRFRGRYRPCKHVKALREAEALLAANAVKWAGCTVDNCKPDSASLENDYAKA